MEEKIVGVQVWDIDFKKEIEKMGNDTYESMMNKRTYFNDIMNAMIGNARKIIEGSEEIKIGHFNMLGHDDLEKLHKIIELLRRMKK